MQRYKILLNLLLLENNLQYSYNWCLAHDRQHKRTTIRHNCIAQKHRYRYDVLYMKRTLQLECRHNLRYRMYQIGGIRQTAEWQKSTIRQERIDGRRQTPFARQRYPNQRKTPGRMTQTNINGRIDDAQHSVPYAKYNHEHRYQRHRPHANVKPGRHLWWLLSKPKY